MGKGDKKTKRGKIIIGSFGVSRPRLKRKVYVPSAVAAKPAIELNEVEVIAEDQAAKKKPVAKKTSKKEVEDIQIVEGQPEVKKTKKPAAKKPASEEIQFGETAEEVKD